MAKKPSHPPPRGSVTSLTEYRRKRDFRSTAEPRGGKLGTSRLYIVQKHAASRLHYDFRLELDGTLKSWAVPKGPSVDPKAKRLAVHVEDHPIEYGSFEGTIPKGEYGGGTVMLWDRGSWEPIGDPRAAYRAGRLKFRLHGERLQGLWSLVRMSGPASENGKNWLLIKDRDDAAGGAEPVENEGSSIVSGRTMEGISRGDKRADAPATAARKARTPSNLAPQLATLAGEVPAGDEWLHEIKLDGYRILAVKGDRGLKTGLRLISRNGKDWTERFPTVAAAVAKLPLRSGILDGEVVALRADGKTDFQVLQNVLKSKNAANIVYFVFDLPFYAGKDLRPLPLLDRKRVLAGIIPKSQRGTVRLSDHFRGDGMKVYEHACRLGLEGIVSKRIDAPYESKRSPNWRKIKCSGRQELIIAGWTDPQGARTGFGALLLAHHDSDGRLVYAGKVGTGFDQKILADLTRRLARISAAKSPFDIAPPRSDTRGAHWVRPEIVAEIEFTEWTQDGRLRHPSFVGIREDKEASEIVREPVSKPAKKSPSSVSPRSSEAAATSAASPTARLTHPERVLWPESKLTKAGLAAYYQSVADLILPHIVGRPLAIVRCPDGYGQPCFFQKHVSSKSSEWLHVDDLAGLLGLVQMSALEIHPWGAMLDRIDRPDRLIFDLDPGPGVAWRRVIDGARAVRAGLEAFGLESFVRTSGGKGLHVVVPLARRSSWDELKGFARAIADGLVQADPNSFIATASKARRPGKIFIDWLRNGEGATAIASYATRARPGAPVSVPLTWDELSGIRGGDVFKVKGMAKRVAEAGDPWPNFFTLRQTIPASAIRSLSRGARRSRGG